MNKIILFAGSASIKIALKHFDTLEESFLVNKVDYLFISTDNEFLERTGMPESSKLVLPKIQSNRLLDVQNGIEFSKAETKLVLRLQSYKEIILICDSFVYSYLLLINSLSELSLTNNIKLNIVCLDSFSHYRLLDRYLQDKITYILPKKFVQFLPAAKNYRKDFERQMIQYLLDSLRVNV